MSQKRFVGMLTVSLFLIGALTLIGYFSKRQEALHQRQFHLLCEELLPGMSKEEVFNVIRQKGDFRNRFFEFAKGQFHYDIYFLDQRMQGEYGDFSVFFVDWKYYRAVRPASASEFYFEIICTFDTLK